MLLLNAHESARSLTPSSGGRDDVSDGIMVLSLYRVPPLRSVISFEDFECTTTWSMS